MILRRPYAFLVKYFKLIHAILLLGSVFLVYKTYKIVSFLGSYIRNNNIVQDSSAASQYVPFSIPLVTAIMAIICGIIIYLLRYKNKPIKTYLYILIFHTVMFIVFSWLSSFIADLAYSSPSIRFLSILRDFLRFSIIIEVIIIGVCFIRAVGFDVTKFDFKKDLLDLGVEKEDNEEYEFDFKVDKDELKAKYRKGLRYFKYFYKENKYIFDILKAILVVIVLVIAIKFLTGIEKVYKENQYFSTDYFKMRVVESYKTKTNTFGNKLNDKYSYVIVKMEFENKMSYDLAIGTNAIKLSFGDYELISPITSENSKFTEFGVNYYSQIVKSHEKRMFNFIFEVPVEFYNDSFKLKYLYDIEYEGTEINYKYMKVSLSPKTFEKEAKVVKTVSLGEELSFEGSILGNTKLKINEAKLNDTFYYNTIKCSNLECFTRAKSVTAKTTEKFDLTLLRLNYSIDYDYETLGQKYTNEQFFAKIGSIRFEVNGKEYNNRLDLVDVTPYYTNDYAILQVRDKLKIADKIYLDFVVRDKIYTYVIKDNTVKKEEEKEGE